MAYWLETNLVMHNDIFSTIDVGSFTIYIDIISRYRKTNDVSISFIRLGTYYNYKQYSLLNTE